MGQYWKLINVDKKETLHEDNIKAPLYCHYFKVVLETLVKVPNINRYQFTNAVITASKQLNSSSPLISLPQELIDAFASYVAGPDLIALAFTCTYFFKLLAPRLPEAIIGYEAPWAGDRLVLCGDYAEGLPVGMCTDAEERELFERALECQGWEKPEETEDGDPFPESTREFMDEIYDTVWSNPLYSLEFGDGVKGKSDAQIHYHDSWYHGTRAITATADNDAKLLQRLLDLRPLSGPETIIRNLTTKEYLRKSAIKNRHSLGSTLGALAMWTNDGWSSFWAVDRMDISSIATIDGSWMDLSQVMLCEVGRVLE